MQNDYKKVFLASNGAGGFVSFFDKSYNPREGWRAFIIKGGPGTGKSSIMKTVAKSAKAAGCDPWLVYCSSDPDSLDGVIIWEQKAIVLDGTAPHVVEPSVYGACEVIVNPGDYLNVEKIRENSGEIMDKTYENKFYHRTASRYLAAAGQVETDNLRMAHDCLDLKALKQYTFKKAKKYFSSKGTKQGKAFKCFLSATTSKGVINYTDNLDLWCKNQVIIEDKYDIAAVEFIKIIKAKALDSGYDVIAFCDPMFPDICRHVVIPELSLGFFSENSHLKFETKQRRIHTRRFYKTNDLLKVKNKMRFNSKVLGELYKSAVVSLGTAKQIHDEIEQYYISAMDFESNKAITEKLLKAIFNKKIK